MTGKERINRILNRQDTDRCAFWMGNPHDDALKMYLSETKLSSLDELSNYLGSDLVWIMGEQADWDEKYSFLEAKGTGELLKEKGIFSDAEDISEILNSYWPDPCHYDFSSLRQRFDAAKKRGAAIMGGMWTPFWHILTDYFGMEECFIKMYTNPEIIHATISKLEEFYLKANKLFLDMYASETDIFFFGNDLGSQIDCLISPEMFREFLLPTIKKIVALVKSYNLKIAFHSCGSIYRLIPDIIEAGIDILHPIQAKAKDMDAENLQKNFGGKLIFMGGLDTQEILPFKSEKEVEAEAERIKDIFGKYFILSPSHEALLPNVPFKNVLAMAKAACNTD